MFLPLVPSTNPPPPTVSHFLHVTPAVRTDCVNLKINNQIKQGDTIGVALDFTDLPMLFFTLNGAPLGHGDEVSVMRIRGTVFPAFGVSGGAALSVTFAEKSLAHPPPRKCEALIVGQDMM